MAKSDDRRDELLDLLADHVLAHGLAASSLRPLAKAAGLSDRMLLYYFKDKSALLEAILRQIVVRLMAQLERQVAATPLTAMALENKLLVTLQAPDLWPFMCVWLEIATLSARGDAFYKGVGGAIGAGFVAWIGMQLDSDTQAQRDAQALDILTKIEGVVVLRSVGLIGKA